MIRRLAGLCHRPNQGFGLAAAWLLLLIALADAGSATAAPGGALAAGAVPVRQAAGALLMPIGLCPDGHPCADYEEAPYEAPRRGPPAWDRKAPPPYPDEAYEHDDCIEDRYAARAYAIRTPPPPLYGEPAWEEHCGIRCWYRRLREGYCGRGCDYYRFRMTAFPEGHLGRHPRRVACRVDR